VKAQARLALRALGREVERQAVGAAVLCPAARPLEVLNLAGLVILHLHKILTRSPAARAIVLIHASGPNGTEIFPVAMVSIGSLENGCELVPDGALDAQVVAVIFDAVDLAQRDFAQGLFAVTSAVICKAQSRWSLFVVVCRGLIAIYSSVATWEPKPGGFSRDLVLNLEVINNIATANLLLMDLTRPNTTVVVPGLLVTIGSLKNSSDMMSRCRLNAKIVVVIVIKPIHTGNLDRTQQRLYVSISIQTIGGRGFGILLS